MIVSVAVEHVVEVWVDEEDDLAWGAELGGGGWRKLTLEVKHSRNLVPALLTPDIQAR